MTFQPQTNAEVFKPLDSCELDDGQIEANKRKGREHDDSRGGEPWCGERCAVVRQEQDEGRHAEIGAQGTGAASCTRGTHSRGRHEDEDQDQEDSFLSSPNHSTIKRSI